MLELKLGKLNNIERKFIPTKKDYFESYINSLKKQDEHEIIQTFKDGYKYRCYNDHEYIKYTRNKKMKNITEVVEIDEKTFNDVLNENNKCIKKTRKYYYDNDFEIDIDCFSEPLDFILVEVSAKGKTPLEKYIPPKGFVEVTDNDIYQNSNIYNGSIISSNTIIEGTDGVGKSVTIEELLKQGIICQDRCTDVISSNMLFDISMEERVKKYQEYLKIIDKKIIILVNNDKNELEKRINQRTKISKFDKQAYEYNNLYLKTFKFMKEHNMLMNKLFLVDTTNLSIKEQTEKVKNNILS